MSENIDLKGVLATLDEFGSTFDKANDQPSTAQNITKGVGDGVTTQPSMTHILSGSDRLYMQRQLMKLSEPEVFELFRLQMGKRAGVPLEQWMTPSLGAALAADPVISRALDTTGGAALIRQDLEPMLYTVFVKAWPAYDRFAKEQANGLVHTWNQITSYGSAAYLPELGTVTDDTAVYERQTTNIAGLATRRGVTFKEQLAVPAGGMSWDAQRLEIQQGLRAMINTTQHTIFQGQASNSGGTASNELGLYDPNAFTGLRSILNTGNAVNFSPYLTSAPDTFVNAIDDATVPITDAGGNPNIVYMRAKERNQYNKQQVQFQRFVNTTEVVPGIMTEAIASSVGLLPIVQVPGDSIGHYTASTFSDKDVADVYVLDDSTISLPYLGSPGPSVLEIPPGVSGQLSRLFIIWYYAGMAVKVIPFSNKARANQATS